MLFSMGSTRLKLLSLLAALSLGVAACTSETPDGGNGDTSSNGDTTDEPAGDAPAASDSGLSGSVASDGSSTVYPIAEAMAEEFMNSNSGVDVTVGLSGSGGGFKKFCAGETDLSNASRPIKQKEIDLCAENGIEFIELPVAYDGISVVVNTKNDWAQCVQIDDLKIMWDTAAQDTVSNWNQVGEEFPEKELKLYGPGTDSGTYDYFTEVVTGEEGASRGDFTASEDDNVLVQGVAGDEGGLGFFGYAYYEENKDQLKVLEIDDGAGNCVAPSPETIADGTYTPLSRPLFVYVKKDAIERPEIKSYVEFFLASDNQQYVSEVGYVALPEDILELVRARFEEGKTGSVFGGEGAQADASVKDALTAE